MLIRAIVVLVIFLILGAAITTYSYGQLLGEASLFKQSSISIDGHNYEVRIAVVDLTGKYGATVTGTVSGSGCCIDFYILNATSWNAWVTNASEYPSLPLVHLNSSVVESQSPRGNFTFPIASSVGLILTFVNDRFPTSSGAVAGAALSLQYSNLYAAYGMVTGLLIIIVCVIIGLLRLRRSPRMESNAPPPSPPQPPMRVPEGTADSEDQSA